MCLHVAELNSSYKKINHKKYESISCGKYCIDLFRAELVGISRAIQMVVCEGGDWQIQSFEIQPRGIQFFPLHHFMYVKFRDAYRFGLLNWGN